MKNLTINRNARTIEVSKRFDILSSRFGSEEYKMLQEVRRDYPGYKVVVAAPKASKSSKPSFKGLTYEYMEKYISKHDDEQNTIMEEYMILRGMTDDAEEAFAESLTYQEIKTWFLDKYPAIASFHETRAKLVETAQKKKVEARKTLLRKQMEARRNALLKKTASVLFISLPNILQHLRHFFPDVLWCGDGHIVSKSKHPSIKLLADCHRHANLKVLFALFCLGCCSLAVITLYRRAGHNLSYYW